jgi:hypothetical protein
VQLDIFDLALCAVVGQFDFLGVENNRVLFRGYSLGAHLRADNPFHFPAGGEKIASIFLASELSWWNQHRAHHSLVRRAIHKNNFHAASWLSIRGLSDAAFELCAGRRIDREHINCQRRPMNVALMNCFRGFEAKRRRHSAILSTSGSLQLSRSRFARA